MYPNFLIIGAPKAGTTSLYYYLKAHPDVYFATPKELNFFSGAQIKSQNLYYNSYICETVDAYKGHFSRVASERAVGEASVSYLFYPDTAEKIFELLPDIKIVVILRDPVKRAFSHYLMDYNLGLVEDAFEDIALQRSKNKRASLYYQQYIKLGFYGEQLQRYYDVFPADKIKVLFSSDLERNSQQTMKALFRFLDVDESFPLEMRQYNAYAAPANRIVKAVYSLPAIRAMAKQVLPGRGREFLKSFLFAQEKPVLLEEIESACRALYRSDIIKTQSLVGKDLSGWL